MKHRDLYLRKLLAFQDQPVIKVITGMRRSGKSFLLELYREALLKQGIPAERILSMNFESFEWAGIQDARALHDAVKARMQALYLIDRDATVRASHQNPAIQRLYAEFLDKPLSHKSHELLHTHYASREPVM